MVRSKLVSENFIQILLLINSITIVIPNKFKAYGIALFLIFTIIYSINNTLDKKKFEYKKLFSISVLFFLFILSLTYSLTFTKGFNRISTMATILVFPLIFGLLAKSSFKITKTLQNKVFWGFILSNFIFIIISFLYFWNQEFTFSQTIIHYSNLINIRLGLFSVHPIYLSLYTGVSTLILIYIIKSAKNLKIKIISGALILFFFVILAILMRKGPILFLLISLIYLLLNYFKIKKTIIGALFFVLTTFIAIQYLPKYKNFNRFDEITTSNALENPSSSTAIRYKIYDCSIQKISESPLIGYGVGNTQQQLDPCYAENGIDLSIKTYNCHNQYFSILLTTGFVGLIVYFLGLYNVMTTFIKNQNYLAMSIIIYFLLNFLTENIIERENGMILYSFFLSYFVFYPKLSKES
jgi:O-antigen ligase